MEIGRGSSIRGVIETLGDEAVICMLNYGLHCVGCAFNEFDTIENGGKIHGLPDEVIDTIVSDLNEISAGLKTS